MSASRGVVVRRLLTFGWAVVAAAPVSSAISMIRTGWTPVIDNSLIASLTVDSVSLHPPLVGMPASLVQDGERASHAGPLGFWLLAIPTKVMGEPGYGLIVGSVLVYVLTVVGLAMVLRRRGDAGLEAISLVLVGIMVAAMGAATFASPFNPHLGVLPLLLCMISTWGVLSGHHRQLWVLVPAGSLAAQTHLGYVPIVGALVVLTAVGLAVDVARSSGERRRRLTRTIIPVGVVIGVVAWIGPILDQLFGSQNLTRLLRSQSGDQAAAGFGHGRDLAVEMTSLPPRWLLGRARDQDLSNPSTLRVVLSLVALALVAGLLVWAVRRRDRALGSLVVVSGVCVVVATITSARLGELSDTPFVDVRQAILYRLFWWPVGVLFSLTLVWGTARVAAAELRVRSPQLDLRPLQVPALALVVVAVLALVPVAHTNPAEGLEVYFRHELPNADAIAALPGSPETVVLRFEPEGTEPPAKAGPEQAGDVWDLGPNQRYGYAGNLVAQLRLRGIEVHFTEEPDGVTFMHGYRDDHRADGDEPAEVLYLVGPEVDHPPAGYRRISTGAGEPGDFTLPTAVYVRT